MIKRFKFKPKLAIDHSILMGSDGMVDYYRKGNRPCLLKSNKIFGNEKEFVLQRFRSVYYAVCR
jgi:hypothetical protein